MLLSSNVHASFPLGIKVSLTGLPDLDVVLLHIRCKTLSTRLGELYTQVEEFTRQMENALFFCDELLPQKPRKPFFWFSCNRNAGVGEHQLLKQLRVIYQSLS